MSAIPLGDPIALLRELVRVDSRNPGLVSGAPGESAVARLLGDVLRRWGFRVQLMEVLGGRPNVVARIGAARGGRTLMFNGHLDTVGVEGMTHAPFACETNDGLLYGRGSCDMKGGIAAMVVAAEVLARREVLAGGLLVATNTDEESSGAGGSALVAHGVRADGAVVTEPTGLDVWISCRGSTYGQITVPGRAGHAEIAHPHWSEGGAVNAIEKAQVVVDALRRLGDEWGADETLRHPRLSAPAAVATRLHAGDWAVTIPGEARVTIAVMFVPQQADEHGWASNVQRDVAAAIARACADDDWLAVHAPTIEWWPNAVMPLEIDPSHPIVADACSAVADLGGAARLTGLDSWYDGATFTLLAGTPAVGLGPSGLGRDGAAVAHAVDEHVPVVDLVRCAQAIAVTALRFCGTVGD